ncbi:host specificity factor TipJ family phage tail protein, partial [Propionivibrio sp.]|uniref:host specificity factor TipJ family phage tail protein n=1 Tax=Propionivibrio sp. TaxID=2212460 RepID=UPI003BF02DAE
MEMIKINAVETRPPMPLSPIADALTVTYSPHPYLSIDRQVLPAQWSAGRTVREYLVACGVDTHREIVIRIDGRLLTVAEWDTVCPSPGDIINVEGVVSGSGGEGGSNPIAMILMIAVMFVAPHLAVMMNGVGGLATVTAAGALTMTGTLVAGVISMAGNMIISALFRPSQPSAAAAVTGQGGAESPTYSLSGGSNRMRPYEPLAVLMGNHRIFPDYGSKPYTEYEGDDQYLYQVFNFGIGDLALSDLRIGETPLADYQGVTLTRAANGVLPGFYGNVDTTEGAELTYATGWVKRTSGTETTRLAVDIAGTFFRSNDEGGIEERSADINVEYSVKDANAWQSFIPTEYAPITHYWAKGYTQTTVTEASRYFSVVTRDWIDIPKTSVSVWVQKGFDPNLSASAHANGDAADYDFGWNYIAVIANSMSGDDGTSASSTPALTWQWVAVGADPHPASPYNASTNTLTLSGSSTKVQRKTLSREVPSGQYDIRVRRASADETDIRSTSTVGWQVLRSYQEGIADYTNQTVLGVKIKASGQLNGALQQLSALATQSAAVWTGSDWAVQATTNPAWWYLNFILGYRDSAGRLLYGCGLTLSQVDVEAIKAWAVFCTANGLSFSAVLDRQQNAADVMMMIARCGFASPSWASGKLGIVWDAPNQTPVMAFGMSNICKGSFEVAYVTESPADEIVVSYTNRNNNWQQDQVRVTVPGTVGTPLRPSTMDLMGCTTNLMAAKFANAMAAQQVYRRRMVTWETDFEGFVCQRGDVVILSHDLTQWGYSGRLVEVDGGVLTLDRAVPRSGSTDHLMLQAPDGSTQMINVAAGEGEVVTLTLPSEYLLQTGYPAVDHKWYFSPLPTPGKKVKIVSVQPLSESRIRLIATDEDAEYYAAWDGVFTAPAVQTRLLQNGVAVSNLKLTLYQIVIDNFQVNRVTAIWSQRGETQSCIVRAWLDGVLFNTWSGVVGASLDIDLAALGGTLSVEVTPVGPSGNGVSVTASLLLSLLPAPTAPTVTATPALFAIDVTWQFGDARQDIKHTELWFSTTNNRSAATRIMSEPFPGNQYVHIGMEPGAGGYYWARVADTRGNLSEWSSSINAGVYATVSTDPSDLLLQLQNALGMPQMAADLAEPIALIPGLVIDIHGIPAIGEIPAIPGILSNIAVIPSIISDVSDIADITIPALIADQDSKNKRMVEAATKLDRASGDLSEALLRATVALQENRDTMTDAGIVIDPATGNVTISALDQAANHLSAVSIRVNAAEASITQKASYLDVNMAIAAAQLSPSELAALDGLNLRMSDAETTVSALTGSITSKASTLTVENQEARLVTAENDIDSLEGQITNKVETSVFNTLGSRVSTAETSLTTLNGSGIIQSVSDIRRINAEAGEDAETNLRNTLAQQAETDTRAIVLATAKQELLATVHDGLSAESVARTTLATQLASASADIVSEMLTRSNADSALSSAIITLQSTVAGNTALIQTEQTARAAADSAEANARTTLAAKVAGDISAAVQVEQTARAGVAETVASMNTEVRAEFIADATSSLQNTLAQQQGVDALQTTIAAAKEEITASLNNGISSEITARLTLEAKVGEDRAAFQEEVIARVNSDYAEVIARETMQADLMTADAALSAAVQAESFARVSAIAAEANARTTLATKFAEDIASAVQTVATSRSDAVGAVASYVTAVEAKSGDDAATSLTNTLAQQDEITARINTVAAARQELTATINEGISSEVISRLLLSAEVAKNTAAIEVEQITRADTASAEASYKATILAKIDADISAAIQAESFARVNADSAEAIARTNLESKVGDNLASALTEYYTKTTADEAIASSTNQVQARLDTGDYSVVKTSSETSAGKLGDIEAKWSVKTQTMSDGVLAAAGIELLSGAPGQSTFAVLADKFLIYAPSGTGVPKQVLSLGTVNAVTA